MYINFRSQFGRLPGVSNKMLTIAYYSRRWDKITFVIISLYLRYSDLSLGFNRVLNALFVVSIGVYDHVCSFNGSYFKASMCRKFYLVLLIYLLSLL